MIRSNNRVIDFQALKIDALLVTALPNVRYVTGFTGSNGVALITPDRTVLFTDPRYTIRAGQEFGGKVVTSRLPLALTAIRSLGKRSRARIGVEAEHLSHAGYETLLRKRREGQRLRPVAGVVEAFRAIKDQEEITAIRAAVEVNSHAFSRVLKRIKLGVTEKEIAAELDYQQKLLGADGASFDAIVSFGPRSALPHASPSAIRLENDAIILMDVGANLNGYASDMTRMAVLGKAPTGFRRMYQAVLKAQLAAIDSVREGVTAESVDRAARNVLKAEGLDKLFVHSTGHGLGLEIHEAPSLRKKDKTRLRAGMVITIEPGVYKEGFGGVRIEDTVVVTPNGCEILTPTTKELICL